MYSEIFENVYLVVVVLVISFILKGLTAVGRSHGAGINTIGFSLQIGYRLKHVGWARARTTGRTTLSVNEHHLVISSDYRVFIFA